MTSFFVCSSLSDHRDGSGDRTIRTRARWKSGLALLVFVALWVVIIAIVNPVGEFMTNDDWSFVRIVEVLRAGQGMIATGWGPGGPSAIVHVLWGGLFADLFGFSLTTLRLAVLCAGILASVALFVMLRHVGVGYGLGLLGALTAVVNPLFLSQCFTFMTDITFACLLVSSTLFLIVGTDRSNWYYLGFGLVLALASILTRQIGLVVPLGLIVAWCVHPAARKLHLGKIILMIVIIVLVPWLAYEYFLAVNGSTPLSRHALMQNIWRYLEDEGLRAYLLSLWDRFFYYELGYICFFISPLLLLRVREIWTYKPFRYFFLAATVTLMIIETITVTGIWDPRVVFYRNVVFDFGIGPILLKDTYVLRIPRTFTLPKPIYILMVYWAALAVAAFLCLATAFVIRLFRHGSNWEESRPNVTSTLCFIISAVYLAVITVTGFHDRYIIPACMLLTVWVLSDRPAEQGYAIPRKRWVPAVVVLISLAGLSVAGVRDFMELKRAQQLALVYVEESLGAAPCDFDGGFEHNGYHCDDPHFVRKQGLSWWWVSREDYVLTLGPLPGYEIVKTFPFARLIGKSGAVHVLRPHGQSGPIGSKRWPKDSTSSRSK